MIPAGRNGARAADGRFPAPSRTPVSTYRIQLGSALPFAAAREIVPYLAELGVTDCYCSPFLLAATGSQHGYDICSHDQLNPDLGTEADYDSFCEALRSHGLGQILDVVPNHMGIDPAANVWWRDVLENGPSSPYADFFDIDWEPAKAELKGKLLLPTLGDQYGVVLERGELRLALKDGAVVLRYHDRELPLNPRQSPRILRPWLAQFVAEHGEDHPEVRELLSVVTALQNLPPYTARTASLVAERRREKEIARERMARLLETSAIVGRFVEDCLARANGTPGEPGSFGPLHDLLEAQAYRLASWRTAFDEINYRRFFDINDLAGLRIEEPRVFELSHRLVLRLVGERKVTGIRVDHPDGLFDPAGYFVRLEEAAGRALTGEGPDEGLDAEGVAGIPNRPLYVVAEKILSAGERLRPEWALHGTTGYDFLNDLNGLFIEASNVRRLRRIYGRLTGRGEAFSHVAYEAKKLIMLTSMASELNVLAHALNRISEASWRSRDFTLNSLRKALMEVIACFPVYRTYVAPAGSTAEDRAAVDTAIGRARRRNPAMEPTILGFLRDVLLPDDARGAASLPEGPERFAFAMKFQQYSGPVHAKGVEDTAFYRQAVLLSLNEVGGHPERPGVSPEEFHAANARRRAEWPLTMLATSTHDTKRGEDARARLNVLSEMPEAWRAAVSAWMRVNAANRTRIEGEPAPDRHDEYLLYQALLGAWPAEPATTPIPDRLPEDLQARIAGYLTKASKEAKIHTSWINPDEAYDRALLDFVRRSLGGPTAPRFLASFVPFARELARLGAVNALAQLVLKLAAPGVPDIYQGGELWNLSLVDPDNRRPVDFALCRELLAGLRPTLDALEAGDAGGDEAPADVRDVLLPALLASWHDARIKLLVTARGLRLRRRDPVLFLRGDYVPLLADELGARHVVAFARRRQEDVLIVAAPRWVSQMSDAAPFPLGVRCWKSSRLLLPAQWRLASLRNLLTGERVIVHVNGGTPWAALGELFRTIPGGWWSGRL
jgi:(1->4)-alpha-D-glucan 1-alpha-D-glucosylmutase